MKLHNAKLMAALAAVAGWFAFTEHDLLAEYNQLNLVGYRPGMARNTDPDLNGWGMAYAPGGPFCNANTVPGVAKFYDDKGRILPLVITIPPAPSQPFGPSGTPTGLTYNPTREFVISKNGRSAPALFIFDSLDGTISGWNPLVDPTRAVTVVDNSTAGSVYSGLTLGRNSHGQNVIYAANFAD